MSLQPTPSLRRVALRAGVSTSTASRVMTPPGKPERVPISRQTRERVLAAAKELNYVPSATARALRQGRSRTIGVLGTGVEFFRSIGQGFRSGGGAFIAESMRGLLSAAMDRGHHVGLLTAAEPSGRDAHVEESAIDLGVCDGLLIFNRDLTLSDPVIAAVRRRPIPTVYVLEFPVDDPDAWWVTGDDLSGARLAVRHFVMTGRRRVVFARRPYFRNLFDRRQAAWRQAMREAGLCPPSTGVAPSSVLNDTATLDADVIRRLMSDGVDAMFCVNEHVAADVLRAARDAGATVPNEIAVARYGYVASPGTATDGLPVAAQPLAEIVSTAVHVLIDRIEMKVEPEFPVRRTLPFTWQSRFDDSPHLTDTHTLSPEA